MSGGIDSSVAAALLKRAGFDVIGVFMKFWSEPRSGSTRINTDNNTDLRGYNRCCSPEAEMRARKVAKILKIPFYVFNFEKEFKKRIVDYFLKEYRAGKTPNPCVVCNKEIKFGLLLEKSLSLDADFVATGHYARKKEVLNFSTGVEKVNYKLLRGRDKNKDQSYFLWMLSQKQLSRILFPIGDYTRKEVENLARKFKLPVLQAKKSVEVCFIKTTINDFLKQYLKEKTGNIVDATGKIIGKHQGLWFYTIGQRKGIGLPGGPAFAKASAGKPYYVLDKDFKKNLLIVTKNEKDLYEKELTCKNVNWIRAPSDRSVLDRAQKICALVSGKEPKLPLKVKAKIRYRHKAATVIISRRLRYKVYSLKFKVAQRAITPGQSVVFYLPRSSPKAMVRGQGQELLGGGIIC